MLKHPELTRFQMPMRLRMQLPTLTKRLSTIRSGSDGPIGLKIAGDDQLELL